MIHIRSALMQPGPGATAPVRARGVHRHPFPLGLVLLIIAAGPLFAADFISGADFSHLAFFEARGVTYKDGGQTMDALQILKRHGLNCVRLRLFTSSAAQAEANPYNYINNLEYTLPLAVRVKHAGLRFVLDFHYSDTWADPGKQTKPAAWINLSFAELTQQMRRYNSNCIAAFKAAGAMPEYVQVGNEITSGMLWPDGRVGGAYDTATQWSQFAQLITNAIAGIRDAAGLQMPKLLIHIDRGGDWAGTQWFFDHLQQEQVPFDIIGLSYYPWWHGSLDGLRNCLTNTAQRYGKPVILAETAFPWADADSTNIYGIPVSTNGQVEFVVELAKAVKRLPGGKGAGILWWGAEYQALSGMGLAGFDKKSFFDASGNVLPVVDAFGQLVAPLELNIRLQGTNVLLQWPLSGAGSSLLSSVAPTNPAAWSRSTNPVETSGTFFGVLTPWNIERSRFFRLQSN